MGAGAYALWELRTRPAEAAHLTEDLTRGEGSRRERAGGVVALALAGINLVFAASLIRAMFSLSDVSIFTTVIASVAVLAVATTALALSGTLWVAGLARVVSGLVDHVVPRRFRGRGQLVLVASLLLAAQYAVSDAYTPRVVYRHLARAGLVPARLDHFLVWADDRIVLRKEGDNYTFLHRLYRDWWAAQPAAAPERQRSRRS